MADEKPRYILFSAEIDAKTSEVLLALCSDFVNKGVETIHLALSSPGGSVLAGINAYNVLRALPVKLVTHNSGSVNSIGNVVFLAGDERYAAPNSSFTFHGVGFDVTNQMRFERKHLRERLDSLEADERKIGAIIAERTALSEAEVSELFLGAVTRDPNYARDKGIVHEVRELSIPAGALVHQLVFKR